MTRILHQLGYRAVWNLAVIDAGGPGDGVIVSPRHMSPDHVGRLPEALRWRSFFDPQFYVPGFARGRLVDYPFHPSNVAAGFDTTEYTERDAARSAYTCIDFQEQMEFGYLTVPVRHRPATPADFIEQQETHFVRPFLDAVETLGAETPVLVQLVVNDAMLMEEEFTDRLLDWVTGLEGIQGTYVVFDIGRNTKQIQNPEHLYLMMKFVRDLRNAELEVHVGYLGLEAMLMLCAAPTSVSIGTYENTRSFSIEGFDEQDRGQQTAPVPRVFMSSLLQSVKRPFLGAIGRVAPPLEQWIDDSPYTHPLIDLSQPVTSHQSWMYQHYLHAFGSWLAETAGAKDISASIRSAVEDAMANFAELAEAGVTFDAGDSDEHLAPWLTALGLFERG